MTTNHLSDVPCPLPRRIERVPMSIASPLMQPSPNGRRVGIRIVTIEACSGFTRVTAHRIAQPPKATLSRGSDPAGYPSKPLASFRTYRQLSGWNPPPLMIRAFGAHCQFQTKLRLVIFRDPGSWTHIVVKATDGQAFAHSQTCYHRPQNQLDRPCVFGVGAPWTGRCSPGSGRKLCLGRANF